MTLSWFGRQGAIESASSNRAIGRASISWGSEGARRRKCGGDEERVHGSDLARVFARRGAGDPRSASDWTGTSGPGTILDMRHALTAALLAGLIRLRLDRPPTALRRDGDAERAAVLAVVQRSFDAIQAQGEEGARIWREVLLDRGSMSSVRARDGARATSGRSFAEHLERTANAEPGNISSACGTRPFSSRVTWPSCGRPTTSGWAESSPTAAST